MGMFIAPWKPPLIGILWGAAPGPGCTPFEGHIFDTNLLCSGGSVPRPLQLIEQTVYFLK